MYTKSYEFRYGDLDVNSCVRISSVMDALQDISICHSDSVGYDDKTLDSVKIAWLIDGWRVRFDEPLHGKSTVTVKTEIMTMGACESVRGYEMWQDGKCKIAATAVWYPVNMVKRRVMRIPPEFIEAYGKGSGKDNGIKYERFRPLEDTDVLDARRVEARDLDSNNHMNNVKSAEIILSYLPEDFKISQMCIRYRKELLKDDNFYVCSKNLEGGHYFELKNSSGDSCVMVKVF